MIAKVVLLVAGLSTTIECGANHLCAGLKARVKEAYMQFQGFGWSWRRRSSKAFFVINAENSCNSLSCGNVL